MKILNEQILISEKPVRTFTLTTNNYNSSNTTYSYKQDIIVNYNYGANSKIERQPNRILYIPEKVAEKLEQTLSQNPPDFNVRNYKDYLVYIIHLLYDIPARNRNIDLSSTNGFVPVYKQLLKKKVDEYPKYANYLVDNNILEEDKKYVVGLSSSRLRISPELVSALIPLEITKTTLIKSINKFHDVSRNYKMNTCITGSYIKSENNYYPYLDRHFNEKLKIDEVGASNYLKAFEIEEKIKIQEYTTKATREKHENSLINRINILMYQINYINSGNFYNKVDDNVGRYNSNLTNIKSELRNYITYENKRLYSIDVVSSQPYFSISLLDINLFEQNKMEERIRKFWKPEIKSGYKTTKYSTADMETDVNNNIIMIRNFIKDNQTAPDFQEYKNLILSGEFYETFGMHILFEYPELIINKDIRKYAKSALIKTIFANKTGEQYWGFIHVFKQLFPTVYKLFNLVKINGEQHHLLACILQNLEAETLLDKACGELSKKYPNIILYTIHDSIITTNKYIKRVRKILRRNLYKTVGEYPKFKVECWKEKDKMEL